MHVAGQQVAVTEILGAIEDTVDVDERLTTIARARQRVCAEDLPYTPPVARTARPGSPALAALAEAGSKLTDVAELTGASVSACSRWLKGDRPYPAELPAALEQLAGAAAGAAILALIPSLPSPR